MPNSLTISVENPDQILNAGQYGTGAIIRLQTATTEAGAFADVTGTGSTPTIAVVTLIRSYTGYDPNGVSTSWYRTRFENVGATRLSDWTAAFQVSSGSYCSLDDVKQRLQRTGDTTDDELFSEYIDQATDFIRGYLGRDLLDTGLTYTYDGYTATHGGRCLPIPRGVRSLSLVETAASTGGSFTTVTAGTYFLRPSAHERTPGWPATELWLSDAGSLSAFPRGYDNVRLTGTFGYGTVPGRVQEVALNLVVRAYASRQAGQGDQLGTGSEAGTPTVSTFLSKRDRETLNLFTYMAVA